MPISYELRGVDDIVWRFGEPDCPFRFARAPMGSGGAPFTNERLSNVTEWGGTFNGQSVGVLVWTLEVLLKRVKGDAAIAAWHQWQHSLGTGVEELTWVLKSEGGGERRQTVRLEERNGDVDTALIYDAGYMRDVVKLGADRGYFESDDETFTFAPASFATATVSNYGDLEAPLRYELTGPLTSPTIGVHGEAVTLSGTTIPAGETWTIETDPSGPYIHGPDGLDRWRTVHLNAGMPKSWHKKLKRGTWPLTISASGTTAASSVKVTVPQRFVRGVA